MTSAHTGPRPSPSSTSRPVKTVVQKFGGSSVADAERMRRCAQRAIDCKNAGNNVVVVVSAMGDSTDDLIALASKVTDAPSGREMDQLLATGEQVSIALMAMTLTAMGTPGVSLTGFQVGIKTEAMHRRAKVGAVDRARLDAELAAGRIPVVAGFQGITDSNDVTTLGRGGSDTTAVAVAAALGADVCEIYTDVDGVYTADPRIVADARLRPAIGYDEMMEAASQGAKVIHIRAVELGKKHKVPIRVLHSQRAPSWTAGGQNAGTLICEDSTMLESRAVSTVALRDDIGRVTLIGLPNRPGLQKDIFSPIAAAGISVDDIIQNEFEPGRAHLAFTVDRAELGEVKPIIDGVLAVLGAGSMHIDTGLAKVSAVGVGMITQPGVAATMFRALADENIKIENITTAEIKISCLVPEWDGKRAMQAVHRAFGLGVAGDAGGEAQVITRPAGPGAVRK